MDELSILTHPSARISTSGSWNPTLHMVSDTAAERHSAQQAVAISTFALFHSA
jgi:hypothetical protein